MGRNEPKSSTSYKISKAGGWLLVEPFSINQKGNTPETGCNLLLNLCLGLVFHAMILTIDIKMLG
jgi:hypothetical protein